MIVNGTTPKSNLKQLAEEFGVRLHELLVLAPANDPFNCGGPEQIKQAKWFATVWDQFMGKNRGHLRKCHYKLVSQPTPILKPDGTPYQNTEADWQRLQTWSKYARYLGAIDPEQIIDQRNPEPHLFAHDPVEAEEPNWSIEDWSGFDLPSISEHLWSDFSLPEANVEGYQYRPGEQPYLIELWVEKSTMDDDLIPICRQLGVNLITSTGFQSVTGAIAMFSRAGAYSALGRPVRIFYLSDFDPAGDSMPVAVSRQIQFWHEQFGNGVDIKLTPLALTKPQVDEHNLPTIPIKESDKRKDAFTERHGVEGAVELDALEAIHPGELSRLIRDAIAQYQDDEIELQLVEAGSEANAAVRDAWDDHIAHFKERADDLERRARSVADGFAPKLKALAEEFDAAMNPIRSEAEELQAGVEDVVEHTDLRIELPFRPTAEVEPPDESHWLFSSSRSFSEQLKRYKSHREGK
jgi:hypothetical protein